MVEVKRFGLLIFDDRVLTTLMKPVNRFYRPASPVTDELLGGVQGKIELHKILLGEESLPIRVYGALSILDAQELIDACSEREEPINFAWIDWKDDSARRIRDSELQGLLLLLRLLAYPWRTTMVWMSVYAEELDGEVASNLRDTRFVMDIVRNILTSQQRYLQLPQRFSKDKIWDDEDFLRLSLAPAKKIFHDRFPVRTRRQLHMFVSELEAGDEECSPEEKRNRHQKLLDRVGRPLLEESGAPGSREGGGARWSMASLFPFVIGRLRGQYAEELATFEPGSLTEAASLIREVVDSEQPAVGFLRQRIENLHISGRGERGREEKLVEWQLDTEHFARSFGAAHPRVVEWSRSAHATLLEAADQEVGKEEERLLAEIRFLPVKELPEIMEGYNIDCIISVAEGANPETTRIPCLAADVQRGFLQMIGELRDCRFEAVEIMPDRPESSQILIRLEIKSTARLFKVSNILRKSTAAEHGLSGALRLLAEYFFIEVEIDDATFKVDRKPGGSGEKLGKDAAAHSCKITMLTGLG